jgi:hypothetical protein
MSLRAGICLAPTQRRVITVHLSQRGPIYDDQLKFAVQFSGKNHAGDSVFLSIPLVVKCHHRRHWALGTELAITPIRATCVFASTQPMQFLALPPIHPSDNSPRVAILALRECLCLISSIDL